MREKIKNFLRCKINEMKKEIKCLKLKNLAVQCIHGGLITVSVASAALITILAPLGVTVIVLGLVTSTAAISSSISMKFHFKRKHEKLNNLIKQISILKDQLDYIVECNSELSDEQCRNMLQDFRNFNAKSVI
jgi:hypothetical protein